MHDVTSAKAAQRPEQTLHPELGSMEEDSRWFRLSNLKPAYIIMSSGGGEEDLKIDGGFRWHPSISVMVACKRHLLAGFSPSVLFPPAIRKAETRRIDSSHMLG